MGEEAVRLRKESTLGSPDLGSNPTLPFTGVLLGKPFYLSEPLFSHL